LPDKASRSLHCWILDLTGKVRTREEATVIANYYSQMHNQLIQVRTKQDLEKIIQEMENLKKLVNRYQHESFKYRWSYGLDKNALDKLKSIK
jgi:hypothetical protein